MFISEELKILAEKFQKAGKKLYIVGGYIRNELLGIPHNLNLDIDICSSAKPEEISKIIGRKFKVEIKNATLGSVDIFGEEKYEYTTFRTEEYITNGKHSPSYVSFVDDIKIDAKRRDFTINCIYYDIVDEKFIDFYDGLSDLKKSKVRCIETPDIVFKNDSLRILRMVRLACCLGFDIEEKTILKACENVYKLKYLSKDKMREEVDKILVCDTFYPNLEYVKNAHARAMLLLGEMGAMNYIFPAIEAVRNSNQKDKNEQLYKHILKVYELSTPQCRLASLFHDIGKFYSKEKYNNFWANEEHLKYYIDINLGKDKGLGYNKHIIDRIKKIIIGQEFNKYGLASKYSIRRFIIENKDVFNQIIELMNNRRLVETSLMKRSKIAGKLQKEYNIMLKNGVPFTIKDLKITGDDIIDYIEEIRVDKIGLILNKLFDICIKNEYKNEKSTLLKITNKIIMKNKEFYLEG